MLDSSDLNYDRYMMRGPCFSVVLTESIEIKTFDFSIIS